MSSTMKLKSIQSTKRLIASPPLKAAIRPAPGSPPPRRASVSFASSLSSSPASSSAHPISARPNNGPGSGSRTLYTHASGPLHHFDAPPPPHPLPISRPDSGHTHAYSGPRMSAGEAKPHSLQSSNTNSNSSSPTHSQSAQTPLTAQQADAPQQSSHSHGQHGPGHANGAQAESGSQPILGSTSLTLTYGASAPPFDASPSDRSNLLSGTHGALAAGVVSSAHEGRADVPADAIDPSASEQAGRHGRRIFQLDVGAYGIPKQGKDGRIASACQCAICTEEAKAYAHDNLDNAVQVGEDAYFVQEDALGVADGVGGWSRTLQASAAPHHHCVTCSSASTSTQMRSRNRHSLPSSPSALFARRLMHYCAVEANESHSHAPSRPRNFLSHAKSNLGPESGEQNEMTSSSVRPSLANGGLVPRAPGAPRLRESGNARPFTWPWDADKDESATSCRKEEDHQRRMSAEPVPAEVSCEKEEPTTLDPFEGVIDPVDVLERAYDHAMDAHRVLRRTRVPNAQSPWFLYGLGRSSTTPEKFGLSSNGDWQTRWEPLTIGSSTALLAVLSGNHLRIAHLGDCVGWLFRKGEVVWRSEEMWSGFNCPLQLGPSSPTRPADARRYDIEVEADDILILASDGMGDNLWEEDVLDEVRRAVEVHQPLTAGSASGGGDSQEECARLGRRTLAGILSESLCSRAHQVSTKPAEAGCVASGEDDLPFARRAREAGRSFRGGKNDDISVLVAVISPVASAKETRSAGDSSD